jgi:uncharacterized membrane protein
VWAVVLLALIGAWVSGALLSAHDGGWSQGAEASGLLFRLCKLPGIESARCGEVLDSRWGAIDVTLSGRRVVIPVAYFGLAYFVSIAMTLIVVGRPKRSDRWAWRALLAVICGGSVASVALLGLMAFVLSEWCPLCVAAHAVNLCIAAIVLRWARACSRAGVATSSCREERAHRGSLLPRSVVSAGLASLLVAAGLWMYYDAVHQAQRFWRRAGAAEGFIEKLEGDARFVMREYLAGEPVDLPLRIANQPGESPTGPKLVVFSDFDCAACKCFAARWQRKIVPALGEGVHVEVRHVLLDALRGDGDGRSLSADNPHVRPSLAMEAARLQGGERAALIMHNLLFAHQHDRPEPDYAALARRIGIDGNRLLDDMRREDLLRIVRDDLQLARRLGVEATPAVFLDGRRVPDLCAGSDVFWDEVASGAARLAVTQCGTKAEADPA